MNQTRRIVLIVIILTGFGLVLMMALRQFGVPIGFQILQRDKTGVENLNFEVCESSTSTKKILVKIGCQEDMCAYEYFGQDGIRYGSSGGDGSFTNEMINKAKYVKMCHATTPEYFYRYVGR